MTGQGAEGTADMTFQDGFDDDNGIGFFCMVDDFYGCASINKPSIITYLADMSACPFLEMTGFAVFSTDIDWLSVKQIIVSQVVYNFDRYVIGKE